MSRPMRADLIRRFKEAERMGTCVTPTSSNDARRLRLATERGNLIQVAHRVYARPDYWVTLKQSQRSLHVVRALAAAHPSWVFCGPTAALLFGLSVSYQLLSEVHVLTSKASHTRSSNGIRRHISRGSATETVQGITVTPFKQTVYDCLRQTDFRHGLAIADSALRTGIASKDELQEFIVHQDGRAAGAKQALMTIRHADARAESGGESIARATIIEQGFALPELQHVVRDPVDDTVAFRVDFWWEIEGQPTIIGELDGHEKYVNPCMTDGKSVVEVLAGERLRESHISGTGAKIMRFSFADVLNTSYFVHLLERFGVPRVAGSITSPAGRPSASEARLLELLRNEALLHWKLYQTAEICDPSEIPRLCEGATRQR